ncbi:MAG: protease family protein [Actinomycetota bacterium]|nr:protease family protein [Actinomycetota bacterium]
MTVVEPTGARDDSGDTYPRLLRTPRWRWWRPLLGLLGLGFGVVFGGVVVTLLAVIVATATGSSGDSVTEDALDPDTVLGLLANNLILATIIPAAALAVLVVHQERPGFLASVTGRVRWGMLARLAPLALAVVLVFYGLGLLVPGATDSDGSAPATATLVGLLAVILLTTPLQAAAEEVGFRGYITQAVSSWFARPVVGIVVGGAVSAVCFALAHGVQDPWLFADRFCFGLVASWLAWRTGGLEASVALHTANNLVSLVISAATGSLSDSLTASSLDWRLAALDVTMMVVFALLVDRLVRRRPVATRRVLSATGAVGYPLQRPPTPPPAGRENPWGMG